MKKEDQSAAQEGELLPCPFCGNAPNEWNYSFGGEPHWEIACCMARTGRKKSEARALDAWNRRAPQPPITKDAPAPAQDGVEELRAKLAKFIADQKPTPAAIAKFVNEHMSELYDDGPPPQPTEQPK